MSLRMLYDRLERDSISSYLGVATHDDVRSLYYSNVDNAAGFIVEIAPVQFASAQLIESINAFLTCRWPKNSLVTFTLYPDPNLDPILLPFKKLRGNASDIEIVSDTTRTFLHQWANNYADYLEGKKYEGINKVEVPVPFRNFRAFVSAKVPCSPQNFNSLSADIQLFLSNREALMGGFKTCHVPAWNMAPDQYLKLMSQLWNMGHPMPAMYKNDLEGVGSRRRRPFIEWDGDRLLSEQIVERDTYMKRTAASCRIDGWRVKSHTATPPGQVRGADINLLIGDLGQANLKQITTPFLLALTLDMNQQNHLVTGKGNLILEQKAPLPGLRPKLEKRQKEMMEANAYIAAGGRLIQGVITLCLFGRTESQLKSASAVAKSLWGQYNYKLQAEAGLNLPLFMAAQPLGATHELVTKLKRTFPGPTESFAMLAPIQADSRTASKPMFVFISRRGQLVGHDLRDSPRDYNAVVFAPTGSGKSFATNQFIMTNASVGGRAYIIDVGRSYEKLCRTNGGQYIEFTTNSPISLNIFSLINPEKWLAEDDESREEIDMYRGMCESLLHQMASPGAKISDTERSLLDNLMAEIFDELAEIWLKKSTMPAAVAPAMEKTLVALQELGAKAEFVGKDLSEEFVAKITQELINFSFALKTSRVQPFELINRVNVALLPALSQLTENLESGSVEYAENLHIAPQRLWALIDQISRLINVLKEKQYFTVDALIERLEALQALYDAKGRYDNTPGHLAGRLKPYSLNGRFGQWFKGAFNLEFNNKMVVLELEELAKSEELKQVVMMLILASIEHKIYLSPDRMTPTLVILDELWDLLTGANSAEFVEKAYRRMRKYGASIITITQSIFDMLEKNKSVGNAVLLNSSWKFFLGPSQSEIERAIKEDLLIIDEMQKQMMITTHTQRGLYSEMCYFDPYGQMRLGRLHVDKRTMLLYSTHPLEVAALNAIRGQLSMTAWEAVGALELYLEELHRDTPIDAIVAQIQATRRSDWVPSGARAEAV